MSKLSENNGTGMSLISSGKNITIDVNDDKFVLTLNNKESIELDSSDALAIMGFIQISLGIPLPTQKGN